MATNLNVVRDDWNGFNILHKAAARVGGLDHGLVPATGGKNTTQILAATQDTSIEVLYLLGVDEIDNARFGKSFIIYQGTHGDVGSHLADVILPAAAYTEKSATYVNMEGRVQQGQRAVFAPGEGRDDWAIIRALSSVMKMPLPYDNINSLRAAIAKAVPHLAQIDNIKPAKFTPFGSTEPISQEPISDKAGESFYLTNPIARASTTMASCVELHQSREPQNNNHNGHDCQNMAKAENR